MSEFMYQCVLLFSGSLVMFAVLGPCLRIFRAPEVLLGLPISESLDMWALGCVMGEVYLGTHLLPAQEEYDTVRTMSLPSCSITQIEIAGVHF